MPWAGETSRRTHWSLSRHAAVLAGVLRPRNHSSPPCLTAEGLEGGKIVAIRRNARRGRSGHLYGVLLIIVLGGCRRHDGFAGALTPRLRRRVVRDFPTGSAGTVFSYLEDLPDSAYGGQGRERVQAAMVLASGGQWDRFMSMSRLLASDWRDVLMAGGLGEDNWRIVLDGALGRSRS